MSDKSSSSTVTVGPSGTMLLTILFVILKVLGYINWSWWWVFSPLWISAILVTVFIIFFLLVYMLVHWND